MKDETLAIRIQTERSQFQEHSTPLHLTSSYAFNDAEQMRALFSEEEQGNIYSRYSNPTVSELIEKLCKLERAEAGWATASGMAAVFSTFAALCKNGDHIVSCRSVFGSTHKLFTEILPKWGISHSYVAFDDYDHYENAISPTTKFIYLETPSNPALDIIDLKRVADIAKRKNVLLIVDNCFATPILQKPIEFGADLVIHSATKYIDGQGRTLGGAIVGKQNLIDQIEGFARHSGPCLSPFNAWVLTKSIETLSLRMEKHSANAIVIASKLQSNTNVEWVKYPHLKSHPQYDIAKSQMKLGGGIVTFEIRGGLESGKQFLNKLKLFTLTVNLGDTRSIATHPASTTHSKLKEEDRLKVGITNGLIRLSIGLENLDDILEDIEQALQ